MRGIPRQSEKLLAFQEGLCCMELVSQYNKPRLLEGSSSAFSFTPGSTMPTIHLNQTGCENGDRVPIRNVRTQSPRDTQCETTSRAERVEQGRGGSGALQPRCT